MLVYEAQEQSADYSILPDLMTNKPIVTIRNKIDLTNEEVLAKCKGIDSEELEINESTARCITYLIETADDKEPDEKTLGSFKLNNTKSEGYGHISRNINSALVLAEFIRPFISYEFHNFGMISFQQIFASVAQLFE